VKRYVYVFGPDYMEEHDNGSWVRYDEANDLLQDERDKLARIEKVAQVAIYNWPASTLFSALKTVLQICQDGKATPITERFENE
jgi:hypothetical protein